MEEKQEPLWVPYSTPPQNFWERAWTTMKRYSFVVISTLLLIAIGGLFFILPDTGVPAIEDIGAFLTGEELPSSNAEAVSNPYEGTAQLSVSTRPDGAQVLLDRDTLGTTPLNRREVPAGVYMLSVRMDDRIAVDTVISLRRNDAPNLSFSLRQPGDMQIAEAESPDDFLSDELPETTPSQTPSAEENGSLTEEEQQESLAEEEQQETEQEEPAEQEQAPIEEEQEPAPEPEEQTGTLRLTSDPSGASVFIDGEAVGETPITVSEVAAGAHTVTFQQEGYEPYRTEVSVTPQQRNGLHGELAQQTGTLRLTSDPPGALASIDGETIGETPVTVSDVAVGSRTVTFQMEGYEPYSTEVSVAPRQNDDLHGELTQQMGSLRVLARPWGSIYINGELHKQNTDVWYSTTLPAGQHHIRVVHPSLGARERVVAVEGDQEQSVIFNLNQSDGSEVTALRDSTDS